MCFLRSARYRETWDTGVKGKSCRGPTCLFNGNSFIVKALPHLAQVECRLGRTG